jgi:hypothetical protein
MRPRRERNLSRLGAPPVLFRGDAHQQGDRQECGNGKEGAEVFRQAAGNVLFSGTVSPKLAKATDIPMSFSVRSGVKAAVANRNSRRATDSNPTGR